MKNLLLTATLLLASFSSHSQEDPSAQEAAVTLSAHAIAAHLRSNYDPVHAAYLTQMAWELAHSFASTEQLQQQWLQALEAEVPDYQAFNRINTHALMAQTLIAHYNGMTLNKWRTTNLELPPQINKPENGLLPDQAFQHWVNLPYFWEQIISSQPQQVANWLVWPETTLEPIEPREITQSALSVTLQWLSTDLEQPITALSVTDPDIHYHDELTTALIRQRHHRLTDQPLAFSNDWIEIYQLIELSATLLTADEQTRLNTLLERALEQWQLWQEVTTQIDVRLPELLTRVLTELPKKFKNPDHFNAVLNQDILNLQLGMDDTAAYLVHPIRNELQKNLEVCLNLSDKEPPEPAEPIADNQFNSCFDELYKWATETASEPNLSGNQVKPDNPTSLNRALEMPSVQIINVLATEAVSDESCLQQLTQQPNNFEWLLAAESIAWFHDRWPGLFAAKNKSSAIGSLINSGQRLNQYPSCFSNANPLSALNQKLLAKWERLKLEINNHITDYAETELVEGSDIDLFGSIDQVTRHIPDGLVIKPCDVTTSCGAFTEMEPSAAVMKLFPNHLRLATQFGLGELEICYDQVQWQNRKSVPTHLDNNKIANFEGQLSVRLNGKYAGATVFTQPLLSEQKLIYLFGENNQETLDTACPLPIIGKQINTSLDRGTFGLLPNRLTFLTAQKADVNQVIRNNWDAWLAQIQDQSLSTTYVDEMKPIKTTLNDAFLQHVNTLQQQIYRKLTTSNPSRINDSALSRAVFEFLNQRQLLNHMVSGLYPLSHNSNTAIRAALYGDDRLVDEQFFREAFTNQTNVTDLLNLGDARMSQHQGSWSVVMPTQNGLVNATLEVLHKKARFMGAD
ncbi:hypothetical protein ACFODZ_10855 [Marinicella sediminis]|uniref:Uncharacterized protein n=1 Tax=Marinicella sediminis TaxID=1792834 RepID=A0ABV7JC93_9GAMM|nr:hypothetical protein [Marinicella sediminis]